jgi:hypothetical protein
MVPRTPHPPRTGKATQQRRPASDALRENLPASVPTHLCASRTPAWPAGPRPFCRVTSGAQATPHMSTHVRAVWIT